MIREANIQDFDELLKLYVHLHPELVLENSNQIEEVWMKILSYPNYHMIVARKDQKIVSSCMIVIIPNLTHHLRPYVVVENVMTHENYRNQGLASSCLDFAKKIAQENNCYKIMLMTGSKRESTLRFYENARYNRVDKTGFVMWL